MVGIFQIGMGSMFDEMHPGSIFDFDIREKNLMQLPGFRKKNIKGLSSKIFLVSKMFLKKTVLKKIIQFSAEVAANFDITPIIIHVQRFTGYVYNWSILND